MLCAADWLSLLDSGAQAVPQNTVGAAQRAAAVAIAAVLLLVAWWTTVKGQDPKDKSNTKLFVAFIAFFAIVSGGCFIAVVTTAWAAVFLAAGGCLGGGFILGLLFGYPLSSAKKGADQQTTASNLMQQSADSLSKVVAGATLVEFQKVIAAFQKVAAAISQCAASCCGTSNVFGGGVTGYFFALGFLIGLFLLPLWNLHIGDDSDDDSDDGGAPKAQPPADGAGGGKLAKPAAAI
ncbi:MAG TPA: hypothetical protein VL990_10340 [Acidobacteriaceae bacterium]|nr:hypothetical protein [Acidobacteriaceae bacterium]